MKTDEIITILEQIARDEDKNPTGRIWLCNGKRLMGFEPTTFCMASRRSSQLSYSRNGGAL